MSLATTDLNFLSDLVANQSGNLIADRQVSLLEQKLTQLAVASGLENLDQLLARLRQSDNSALSTKVAEAVTVNETSFFRDLHPFETLKSTLIPDLMAKRDNTKCLRIWCAACSTGQEPYSIAMACSEIPELNTWNLKILATDISEDVIQKAQSGLYTQLEVNRGLPANKLVSHFDRNGRNWEIKKTIKDKVDFRRINLMQPLPHIGQFDIVFIRNVLIYFDRPTREKILHSLQQHLMPDGFLFVGSAEILIGLNLPFERKETNGTTYYQFINA